MLSKGCSTLTGSIAGSINNQRNHVQGANPKGRDIRFRTPRGVHFALTFKHAVEFSSFGCAPRSGPRAVAWGNSTYFTRACARCQTELSCPSRPRRTPGLGGSWHGDTPYPCCFGFGILPARPPRIAPGRPSHREGLDYFTGPSPRCQTEPSDPSPPATASGPWRLLAWRHTVPVLLWVWDPSGTSTPDRSGPSVSPARREEHYGVRGPAVKSTGRPGMSRL